jgi:Xaa-Pro aminopeptidase
MSTTAIVPDDEALRLERRARALAAMEAADIDICVLGREANARYVSGAPRLWTAGSRAFGPGCVLVRATGAVHLLSTWDQGVPPEIPHENLYGISFNAQTFLRVLQRVEGAATARRVATDGWTPSSQWLLSSAFPKAEIVDGDALLGQVRAVKTPRELEAIRRSVRVAEHALDAATAAVRPGATARQITAVYMEAMARQGVRSPTSQDVAWIASRRQPWLRVGRDVPVTDGDVVAIEAGVVADGYSGELGRTVGGDALQRRARELLERLVAACRPGARTGDLLDAYAAAGVPPPPMPVARGLGLGFDRPLVTHALPQTAAAERLAPGMTMLVGAFVWEEGVGAALLAEPVAITGDGVEVLSSRPVIDTRS